MFTLLEPSEKQIEKFLAAQRDLTFSYAEVGASQDEIPANYPINHHRSRLGDGEKTFARAKDAIRHWAMYRLEWTRLVPADAPTAVGAVVVVVVNHGFCWSLNPCRVIYVLEESTSEIERYGFAFGTLPGHSEEGEEKFTVEYHHADDSAWYELLSFARPHHILARIGFPFVESVKRKFAEDSAAAMQTIVCR